MAYNPQGGYGSSVNGSLNPPPNGAAAPAPPAATPKASGGLPVLKVKLGASSTTVALGSAALPKPQPPPQPSAFPSAAPPAPPTFAAPSPQPQPRPGIPTTQTTPSALPPVRIAPPQPYRPPQSPVAPQQPSNPPSTPQYYSQTTPQSSPAMTAASPASIALARPSLKVTVTKPPTMSSPASAPPPVPSSKPLNVSSGYSSASPSAVHRPVSTGAASGGVQHLHYHQQTPTSHSQAPIRMPPPQISAPVPFPKPLQTTGTTVATVMGLNSSGGHAALAGSGGTPKLSSKFVFKVAKPTSGDQSTPMVVAVEQRPKLYIRLPRALVRQELERIKRSKAQKSKPLPPPPPPPSSSKSKKAKRPRDDGGMGPNDEFIDVDGDGFGLPPPPKRQKVPKEAAQAPAATPGVIEGYTAPPEDAILVPFQDSPSYVPVADPARKYMPLKKVLHNTLRSLIQLDRQGFFYNRVTEDQAPGYFDIVKRPMDFSTMRRKIEDNKYPFLSLFQYDFEQIIQNCLDYNEPDTVFYTEAQSVLRQGREIIATNRLKVHPRHLEAPAEVLQYALAEDEKQRQREAEERASGGGNGSAAGGGGPRDFPDPEPPRGSRASAQRAMGAAQSGLFDEDEDALPRSDMDLIRQFVQPPRTFLPKRHYVDLVPQPKPTAHPPGAALPTAAANMAPLPIGRSHAGRGGASGPSTRAIPQIGPDGRPYITPLNRWQLESSMLLKLVNHRYCNGPMAFDDYARSIRAFAGIDDGWAPEALKQKIEAALSSISKEEVANHAPWSALRMIKSVPRTASRPAPEENGAKSTKNISLPTEIQEQLSRLHVASEQLTGAAPSGADLTAEELEALKSLSSELGVDLPLPVAGKPDESAPKLPDPGLDDTISSHGSAGAPNVLPTEDKMDVDTPDESAASVGNDSSLISQQVGAVHGSDPKQSDSPFISESIIAAATELSGASS